LGITDRLCSIENRDDVNLRILCEGHVLLNGQRLREQCSHPLSHIDSIVLGRAHALRVLIPERRSAGSDAEINCMDFDAIAHEVRLAGRPSTLALAAALSARMEADQVAAVEETFVDLSCQVAEANDIAVACCGEAAPKMDVVVMYGGRSHPGLCAVRVTPPSGFPTFWTAAQFLQRQQVMRAYFARTCVSGRSPTSDWQNPFVQLSSGEFELTVAASQHELEQQFKEILRRIPGQRAYPCGGFATRAVLEPVEPEVEVPPVSSPDSCEQCRSLAKSIAGELSGLVKAVPGSVPPDNLSFAENRRMVEELEGLQAALVERQNVEDGLRTELQQSYAALREAATMAQTSGLPALRDPSDNAEKFAEERRQEQQAFVAEKAALEREIFELKSSVQAESQRSTAAASTTSMKEKDVKAKAPAPKAARAGTGKAVPRLKTSPSDQRLPTADKSAPKSQGGRSHGARADQPMPLSTPKPGGGRSVDGRNGRSTAVGVVSSAGPGNSPAGNAAKARQDGRAPETRSRAAPPPRAGPDTAAPRPRARSTSAGRNGIAPRSAQPSPGRAGSRPRPQMHATSSTRASPTARSRSLSSDRDSDRRLPKASKTGFKAVTTVNPTPGGVARQCDTVPLEAGSEGVACGGASSPRSVTPLAPEPAAPRSPSREDSEDEGMVSRLSRAVETLQARLADQDSVLHALQSQLNQPGSPPKAGVQLAHWGLSRASAAQIPGNAVVGISGHTQALCRSSMVGSPVSQHRVPQQVAHVVPWATQSRRSTPASLFVSNY